MRAGEESPVTGFVVVEARPAHGDVPGRFEVQREISPGTTVNFTASTAAEVLDKAAAWLHEQARRKDGGALGASGPKIKVSPKPPEAKASKRKPKDVVEA